MVTMARLQYHSILHGAYGRVGDVVIKRYKYGQVLSRRPQMGHIIPSEKQLAQHERWRAAAAYYQRVKADPALAACYAGVVRKKGLPLSAITTRDFMRPPQVRGIELRQYRGHAGDLIQVVATDDFTVAAVMVTLRDATGAIFEYGPASCADQLLWEYRTKGAAPAVGPITIEAEARDLPGNRATLAQTWQHSAQRLLAPVTPPCMLPPVVVLANDEDFRAG
jgi:hypothetical protein